MQTSIRVSPVDHLLRHSAARGRTFAPIWSEIGGMPVVLHRQEPAAEAAIAELLAIADLSCLPRVVAKGPGAAEFLASQGWPVPDRVLEVSQVEGGGWVARTGASEFLVEGPPGDQRVGQLETALAQAGNGVYRVPRQDAIIALMGSRAVEALRHASAYDFSTVEPGGPVVMTRAAGVSCTVLARSLGGRRVLEISVEGTMGAYFWHTLEEIVRELGGGPVGLANVFPELAAGGPLTTQGASA
jgi:sarcosine oxidase subunit gamma